MLLTQPKTTIYIEQPAEKPQMATLNFDLSNLDQNLTQSSPYPTKTQRKNDSVQEKPPRKKTLLVKKDTGIEDAGKTWRHDPNIEENLRSQIF